MDTRITPEDVKKWYEASGFTPTSGVWLDLEQQQACPFFARFVASHPDAWKACDEDINRFCRFFLPTMAGMVAKETAAQDARNIYGSDYMEGFVRGWDGCPLGYDDRPEYIQGYKDGARAAVEILGDRDE
jgi:hypothetical protein